MPIPKAFSWSGGIAGRLDILDQRHLPHESRILRCETLPQVYEAIQTLAIRGAPAIGIAGAFGLLLGLRGQPIADAHVLRAVAGEAAAVLVQARPTAVNLKWALDRMLARADRCASENVAVPVGLDQLYQEAHAIELEDAAMCQAIGRHGERLVKEGSGALVHCNAGALATGGIGTSLGILYSARDAGRRFRVFCTETRPLLQGSRLTAWELMEAGLQPTLICDSAAGALMKQGKVQAVFVGADRIARNGDTANKIGTYALAQLAAAHGVAFHVAAPSSTFDRDMLTGSDIPIEERGHGEVRAVFGVSTAPDGVNVWNPAFDVTPAELITSIVTEKGVISTPTVAAVTDVLRW